jgi:hypothetical protein
VDCSGDFLALLQRHSLAILNNIVTMDESAISFYTPQTKWASKQWVKKGQPGPRNARVHAIRTKKMVLVFFYAKDVMYTKYIPKSKTVNAEYVKKALPRFLKVFKERGCSCCPRSGSCTGTIPWARLLPQFRITSQRRGSR